MPIMQVILVGTQTCYSTGGVCHFYNISQSTLRRRMQQPRWKFPKPDYVHDGVRYWSEKTLRRYKIRCLPVSLEEVEPYDDDAWKAVAPVPVIAETAEESTVPDGTPEVATDVGLEAVRRALASKENVN